MHIECRQCGAALEIAENEKATMCPYCASPSVLEKAPAPNRPMPQWIVGFSMTQENAQGAVKEWLGRRSFFVKSSVKKGAIDSIRGVYTPVYLYSAFARAPYQAQIGENYQETHTITTVVNGRTVTRTQTVTKTEYRDLSGVYDSYLMDILVTASRVVTNDELQKIEPFDLRTLKRYSPAVISGWNAEDPTLQFNECYALARAEANHQLGEFLDRFMPGDSHHGLQYHPQLTQENIQLTYLPIWVMAIRHSREDLPFRVLINGQTGEIYGKAPLSWVKISAMATIAALLIAIFVILLMMGVQ